MRFILILSLCSSGLFAQDINEKILFAAARDQIDSLNIFLLQDSIDLDYRYENGYSALDYAIERNHKDVFKRLVEYYASVNESKNT
ncbi:ankyrin repeat domain-containing protein, partial [candidate division KSB1 bacterium]|nr:ankyrin repeat domain-containing protein [candidate division KSB1 bacterium]